MKQTRKLIKEQRSKARSMMQEGVLFLTLHTASRQLILPADFLSLTIEEGFSKVLLSLATEIAGFKEQSQEFERDKEVDRKFLRAAKQAASHGHAPLAYPLD